MLRDHTTWEDILLNLTVDSLMEHSVEVIGDTIPSRLHTANDYRFGVVTYSNSVVIYLNVNRLRHFIKLHYDGVSDCSLKEDVELENKMDDRYKGDPVFVDFIRMATL